MLALTLFVCAIFLIAVQHATRKKSFPGPIYVFSMPSCLLPLLLKISNERIRRILMKLCFTDSARFLDMTVPLAAQYYTSTYGDIVEINLFNRKTLIVSNPDFADHILKRNGKNYTLRFGNKIGLEHLGMATRGIIWNGDVQRWKYQRSNFFQKSLNSKTLDDAKQVSYDAFQYVLKHSEQFEVQPNNLDVLDLLRSITFTVTCHLFLGLPIGSISMEKTKFYVDSIVQYFKAWEYFLLKPEELYEKKLLNHHLSSIDRSNQVVKEIILIARQSDHNCLFINALMTALEQGQISTDEMQQCVLEMLIAGKFFSFSTEQHNKDQ